MRILAAFLIFIVAIQAYPNYQQRILYYSEYDNVCKSGWLSDSINITIIIDENFEFNKIQRTTTTCSDWMPYYFMELRPSTGWATIVKKDGYDVAYIIFNEESTWVYRLQQLISVRVKTTIASIKFYDELDYQCSIIGDGISHHFQNVPVLVKCNQSSNKNLVTE